MGGFLCKNFSLDKAPEAGYSTAALPASGKGYGPPSRQTAPFLRKQPLPLPPLGPGSEKNLKKGLILFDRSAIMCVCMES